MTYSFDIFLGNSSLKKELLFFKETESNEFLFPVLDKLIKSYNEAYELERRCEDLKTKELAISILKVSETERRIVEESLWLWDTLERQLEVYPFFVARNPHRVEGAASFKISNDQEGERYLSLELLLTAPHNLPLPENPHEPIRGVGTALINKIKKYALQKGVNRIELTSSHSAVHFYEHLGFSFYPKSRSRMFLPLS